MSDDIPSTAGPPVTADPETAVRLAVLRGEQFDPPDDAEEHDPGDSGGADEGEPQRIDLDCAYKRRNDSGNAERLVARFGADLLYIEEVGWHAWVGTHWDRAAGRRRAQVAARDTAKLIGREAKALEAQGRPKTEKSVEFQKRIAEHRSFSTTSGNAGRLRGMMEIAESHLFAAPEVLDRDPYAFNTRNCTLQLRSFGAGGIQRRRHHRRDKITKCAPVEYDPAASAPKFEAFLKEIMPDVELRGMLQRWFGYCLTGFTGEQKVLLFKGRGANGKSTLLDLIGHVMGEFAATTPVGTLMASDLQQGGGSATPDLARLVGRRLVVASEPETGSKLSDTKVKQMSGGEKMTVRNLNQGFFEFLPEFKLVLSFNAAPQVRGQDDGIWRRLVVVPFDVQIPEARRDKTLQQQLQAESSGVLNWLLDGYLDWSQRGLMIPDRVREATAEYREEGDLIGPFLDDAVQRQPGKSASASALFEAYERWCKKNARSAITQTLFGRAMSEKGFAKEKVGIFMYRDCLLVNDFKDQQPLDEGDYYAR